MLRQVLLVTMKELRATVRDPHVLAYLLFPILLYPGLIIGAVALMNYSQGRLEQQSWHLEVQAPEDVRAALLEGNREATGGREALAAGTVDALVTATDTDGQLTVSIEHVSTRTASATAVAQIRERLDEVREARMRTALEVADIAPEDLERQRVRRKLAKGGGQLTRWLAAVLLCVVVPMGMLVAGVYPAVELIVSERERGTIETTLVAPVPRVSILAGKVLAAVALMMAAGLGNAAALALTANQMVLLLTERLSAMWVPAFSTLTALPVIFATALFLAGANLLAVLPARTFKEGEYAASMVMTVLSLMILAGLWGLVSGSQHIGWLLLPGANAVIAIYHAILGDQTWVHIGLPTAVNLTVGLGLVWLCGQVLDREAALFGGQLPAWLAWTRRFLPE